MTDHDDRCQAHTSITGQRYDCTLPAGHDGPHRDPAGWWTLTFHPATPDPPP